MPAASLSFVFALIVSESQGQSLVTVCQVKPGSSSQHFTSDIHLHTHMHAHARTPTHQHWNMTISLQVSLKMSKCVLASRVQQGRMKKKTSAAAALSLCHIPATRWVENLPVFHPFIIHLSAENTHPFKSRKLIFVIFFLGCTGYVQMRFHWAGGFASVLSTFNCKPPSRPPPTNYTPTLMICGHTWSHLRGGRVMRYATNREEKVQLSDCLFPRLGRCFCSAQREGHAENERRSCTESAFVQSSRRPFTVQKTSPGNKPVNVQFSWGPELKHTEQEQREACL